MAAALTRPKPLLHVEGATVLVLSALWYWREGGGWLLFAVLFFVPDLSAIGYLAGRRAGAAAYNLAHTEAAPSALATFALWHGHAVALSLALIWLAHIGMDRMFGYGFKYATAFKDTHLGRV